MAQSKALIETLKQVLKGQGLTYARVAQELGMSEANIKRMFASGRFSLEHLEDVCKVAQMELTDLVQIYDASRQRIRHLTLEQEQELVDDIKLLLVAVSVQNRLSFDDIVTHYQISEHERIRALSKLDRLKIIDLLPNTRYKLRVDESFDWLPGGPIESSFEKQIQAQFLKSKFEGELERRVFLFGLLSDASAQVMLNSLRALAHEFTEL